jgi:hypothetical protein
MLNFTRERPHPLNYFFASTGYGAYQKELAGAFFSSADLVKLLQTPG